MSRPSVCCDMDAAAPAVCIYNVAGTRLHVSTADNFAHNLGIALVCERQSDCTRRKPTASYQTFCEAERTRLESDRFFKLCGISLRWLDDQPWRSRGPPITGTLIGGAFFVRMLPHAPPWPASIRILSIFFNGIRHHTMLSFPQRPLPCFRQLPLPPTSRLAPHLPSIFRRQRSLGRAFISAPRRDLLKASTLSMTSMTPFLAIAA